MPLIAEWIRLIISSVHFIFVHSPGGEEIAINSEEISSIRQVREDDQYHYHEDVHCVIVMTNGRAIGTAEVCREVIRLLAEADAKSRRVIEEPKP